MNRRVVIFPTALVLVVLVAFKSLIWWGDNGPGYYDGLSPLQHYRRNAIHKVCSSQKKPGHLTTVEKSKLLPQLLIDDKHHIMYCYVPKVACSNWKRVLLMLTGNYTEERRENPHVGLKTLSEYSPEERQYRLDNYYKFMFARHPLDRLYSAWHNKLHEKYEVFNWHTQYYNELAIPIIKQFRGNSAKGDNVTLEEFLKYLLSVDDLRLDGHWMPTHRLCQPCYVNYDFIGVLENLTAEAAEIIDILNLSDTVSFPVREESYVGNSHLEEKLSTWKEVSSNVFKNVVKK